MDSGSCFEVYPVVTKQRIHFPEYSFGEFIQRSKQESYNKVTGIDFDEFTSCSPVLEACARWNPAIIYSGNVNTILATFSNDENCVQLMSDYMRGRKITLGDEEVFRLLSLADMLQVKDVLNYCKVRIQQKDLNEENCLRILRTCSLYNFEHSQMDTFIRANLTKVTRKTGILDLTYCSIEDLLTDEEISYWPMDDRFVFITNWCNAREERKHRFEDLFRYLDLSKIHKDVVAKIVRNDSLVRKSNQCLHMVDIHLRERQDKPVPFAFILNDIRTGSNVLGFNIEDKKLYKFSFPKHVVDTKLATVADSGHILMIKTLSSPGKRTVVYDFDGNSNEICSTKVLQSEEKLPKILSHVLEIGGRIIAIFRNDTMPYTFRKKLKHGSVLYQQVCDNGESIEIEPLLTFTFDVSCACYSQSMIIMSSTTYIKRNVLVCFHLETNKITEINVDITNIQCILPIQGKLFVLTGASFFKLDFGSESGVKTITRVESNKFNTTSRYIACSDYILELNYDSIRLCDTTADTYSWTSYYLEQLRLNNGSIISYGFLDRTNPICHLMCPHCDPEAWEKEERLKELERQRHMRSYDDDRFDDLYDDYDDYDNDWDSKELIWDGSADEFVEAWW